MKLKYGKEIKKSAKQNVKRLYFRNLMVVFLVTLLMGSTFSLTSMEKPHVSDSRPIGITWNRIPTKSSNAAIIGDLFLVEEKLKEENPPQKYTRGVLSVFVNEITNSGSFVFGILNAFNKFFFSGDITVFILIILSTFILLLFQFLFVNPLIVGKNRYFLEQRKYRKVKLESLLFPFKMKKTLHVAYILFMQNIYSFLWSLTIIGGFIKHYEYLMIPYLLAENPNISKKEAFALSKEMMNGEKWEVFKLDISLIGWKILEALTFKLSSIFYYNIYKETLRANLYMDICKQKYDRLEHKELLNDFALAIKEEINESYPEHKYPKGSRKWLKVDFRKNYTLTHYILFFFTFSFIGWVWEVFISLVEYGVLVNRGTFHGPWLPIYGWGGIAILILLKPFREKPYLVFILAFLLCGIIEYGTAWYLEVFKHMKWWDYSGYFMNLHGRICLEGLLVFGLGGCIFMYLAAPILDNIYQKIKPNIKKFVCIGLILFYGIDWIYSSKYPNQGIGITEQIGVSENTSKEVG